MTSTDMNICSYILWHVDPLLGSNCKRGAVQHAEGGGGGKRYAEMHFLCFLHCKTAYDYIIYRYNCVKDFVNVSNELVDL
jgi:hypothetical protein